MPHDSEIPNSADLPTPNPTDAELFQALKDGQTDALGILYDRHAGLVYGLAIKVLKHAQEAEDLTQDIFLTLVRSSTYDSRRGSLRTFLAILTRSRAIDRLRSRSSANQVLERWQSHKPENAAANPPFEYVFQHEQSEDLQAALAQLSDNQQQILRMAYYDGLSQSEIASRLNIPLGTVKARARRGLLNLRQALADHLRSSPS
jgi:RNA polymerase sigma-70 factor (ECF subfamily)